MEKVNEHIKQKSEYEEEINTLELMGINEVPVPTKFQKIKQYELNQNRRSRENIFNPILDIKDEIMGTYDKCFEILDKLEKDSDSNKDVIQELKEKLTDSYETTSNCYNKIIDTIDNVLSYIHDYANNQDVGKILEFCDSWDEVKLKYDYFQTNEEKIYEDEVEDDYDY